MPEGLSCRNGRGRLPATHSGAGLIEVMLALLVFSTAMTGTLAAQAVGMQASAAALQRSSAALYAQDLLARVRANPGAVSRYVATGLGDPGNRQATPSRNCEYQPCSPAELAIYDLWQWETLLLGANARIGEQPVGGLYFPTACLFHDSGWVRLHLYWQAAGHARPADEAECGSPGGNGQEHSTHMPAKDYWRGELVISAAIDRVAP